MILRHWNSVGCATFALLALLGGCASPGPPMPPTLNLPEIPKANSLSAVRNGTTVRLRWATPEKSTDKLLIRGAVTAEICREVGSAPSAPRTTACSPTVVTVRAKPGAAGEATDTLPADLASGPPRLLAYRVQLKNAAGRTAGASKEIFAAAGDAPGAVANFRAHDGKRGAVLEWTAESTSSGDAVEIERAMIQSNTAPAKKSVDPVSTLSAKEPAVIRLRAGESGAADAGGTIDRSAEIGHTYTYTAWRVRAVEIGGQKLELRSAGSPATTVTMQDTFAPDTPTGLVAVPGFTGEGSAAKPAIDLSWDPNNEPRIAGYRVYRQESGEWRMISGAQLLSTTAYRDAFVSASQRYTYRVTAVGLNGQESQRSNEAAETAPTP